MMPNNAFWNWAGISLVILALGSCVALVNTTERQPCADTLTASPRSGMNPNTPTT